MTDTSPTEDSVSAEFQKSVALIGGKERIYLVGDACESKEVDGDSRGTLQEFIREMFPDCVDNRNGLPASSPTGVHADCPGEICINKEAVQNSDSPLTARPQGKDLKAVKEEKQRGTAPKTAMRRPNVYSKKRTIDTPLIVFIFRQTFFSKRSNERCVKEILKDVKARTKRAQISRPTLIGLLRTRQESAETLQCVQILDRLIRAVFHKHSPEAVWVGSFIPNTEDSTTNIKRNVCRVLQSSQTTDNTRDRGKLLFWPFQCLLWPQRRGEAGQPSSSSTSRRRDETGSTEECIPLKNISSHAGPPAKEESAEGGS